MNLIDLIQRKIPPEPWTEGDNIPWNDPAFSERMLREHLSSAHDMASRRSEKIAEHVGWIHREVLSGHPASILDLGCGPGLYTSQLARLGHKCVGIDFSPASIAHAREHAEQESLSCTYLQQDIRDANFGGPFGLVMMVFGQFNVFRRTEAESILERAGHALEGGGLLLLEMHRFVAIERMGNSGRSWYSTEAGLFSEKPHLCLEEHFWHVETQTATSRYFVVDAASGEVDRYALSYEAYTDAQYNCLLERSGFEQIMALPSLTGAEESGATDLAVLVARRQCCLA